MKKIFVNEREILFNHALILRQIKVCEIFLLMIKTIASVFFYKYSLEGEEHEFLFFNTVKRSDHVDFFNSIQNQCPLDKGFLNWKRARTINMKALLLLVFYLPHINELRKILIPKCDVNEQTGICLKCRFSILFLLYLRLVKNIIIKKQISRYKWGKVKVLVTLYDIGEPEHFVVNYANVNNIKTVVLQHGIMLPYFDHKNIDTFNMYNIPSQYFLALGTRVTKLGEKCCDSTPVFINCGKPNILEDNKIIDGLIGIACNIPSDHKENVEMINIAQKYALESGKKIRIRLHPTDKEKFYSIDTRVSTFDKEISNSEIIIGYTTTMIFTYMRQGKSVYRFNGPNDYFKLPAKITFDNYEDFELKIKNHKNVDFKEISKEYISYIGEESFNKYKEAFEYIYNL